jgi:rhodanese-related sulfurtransferase
MRYCKSLILCLALCGGSAVADVTVLIAVEPTSKHDSFMFSGPTVESVFSKATGQTAKITFNEDLTESMRATRTGDFDVFIGPPQVAASALSRGFGLIGSTNASERYVLVAGPNFTTVQMLNGRRMYLPQQDSIYTYMARGILNSAGLSLQNVKVAYEHWAGAGLVAVNIGVADATVVRETEWLAWSKEYPNALHVLSQSIAVPGGLSVVVRNSLQPGVRDRIAKALSAPPIAGFTPVTFVSDLGQYKAVAELGFFTPTVLPGVTMVNASQVRELALSGAVVVDTRSAQEYKTRHIPTAVFAPYLEKSLKDVAFDPKQDDFSAIAALDKNRPTVFSCNGAECWKSYKSSIAALALGFKHVYWFRGGMPEWEASGLDIPTSN